MSRATDREAQGRRRATAWAGLLSSFVAATFLLAPPLGPLPLAGALLLACVPGGAAVMCWIDAGDAVAQAALTLIVSLTLFALASGVLIWSASWHPQLLLVLAATCVVSCLTAFSEEEQR